MCILLGCDAGVSGAIGVILTQVLHKNKVYIKWNEFQIYIIYNFRILISMENITDPSQFWSQITELDEVSTCTLNARSEIIIVFVGW